MYDTELGNRLRFLRKNLNLTQKKVAEELNLNNVTYAHYELSKREPDHETLIKIARYFKVSTDYLLGLSNRSAKAPFDTIETPIALDNLELLSGYEIVPNLIKRYGQKNLFTLTITGDSMSPFFKVNDLITVARTNVPENNRIMIFKLNNGKYLIKKIQITATGIALVPFDNKYEVEFYSNEEIDKMDITIIGKVISIYRNLDD